MPSIATTSLRLEMQGTGENTNTWGIKLNSSTIALIDSAVAGRTYIDNPYSGQALSSVNYSTDQARQPVLQFSGAVSGSVDSIIYVPAVPKMYSVRDFATGGNVQLGVAGGTSVTLPKSGYMPVTVTASGVEDARVYELNPAHAPTNPGGIVTRTSLGLTLSSTGMPASYNPTASNQVVTYSTVGSTLSATGMPTGYSPASTLAVTTKVYVDAQIIAAQLSGTLPGQSGNAGNFLATDGSSVSWSGTNAINLGRHTITTRAVGWTTRTTSGATLAATETGDPSYVMQDGYDFISSANRYITTQITPAISYNGSTIPVTLEFLAFSASGTVYWGVQAAFIGSGSAYSGSYGTAATVSHAITGSGLRQVTAPLNVTVSGTWVSGSAIAWQVYRSGGGASGLVANARLMTVNMYPTLNRATDAL